MNSAGSKSAADSKPIVDEVIDVPAPRSLVELDASRARRLGRIEEIEKEVRRLHAEQLRETAGYVRDQLESDARLGIPSGEDQHRLMCTEVARALGVSTMSASSWLSDAWFMDDALPHTLAALSDGMIGLRSARTIAGEVSVLHDIGAIAAADEAIADEAVGLVPGKVANLARTRVMNIHPEAASERAAKARADRYVSVAAGDEPGVANLNAVLPAEQAAACWHALHDHATAVYAGGDSELRTVGQIMADTLVERLTGAARAAAVKVHVDLVMGAATLLGLDDVPAQLVGIGPIPAEVARIVAATGDTWVRRLFTDPVDCTALIADTRRRYYRGALRDLILTRDAGCRGPSCTTRPSDIDHIHEHAAGGHTTRSNGQSLSKGCHTLRQRPDITVAASATTNIVTWKLPSGAIVTTLPPPALGHGTLTPEQVANRRRLQAGPSARRPPPEPVRQRGG